MNKNIKRIRTGFFWIAAGGIMIKLGLQSFEPEKQFLLFTGGLFIVCAVLYVFWHRLVKLKAVKYLGDFAVKVAKVISDTVNKLIEKFSMSENIKSGNARFIKGYEDIKMKADNPVKRNGKLKKKKRIKNMDAREKIRYVYEKRVLYALKKGAQIEKYMTPRQVGKEMSEKELFQEDNGKLIEIYNYIRYDEESDADKALEKLNTIVSQKTLK